MFREFSADVTQLLQNTRGAGSTVAHLKSSVESRLLENSNIRKACKSYFGPKLAVAPIQKAPLRGGSNYFRNRPKKDVQDKNPTPVRRVNSTDSCIP